jgi:GntR family transcriptional regulator
MNFGAMTFTFSNDERLPLYQRLRDELAANVAENRWRPGEAIPTEAELVSYDGVSIGTVRKAIDKLVAEGLLERFQGRGTFVRRASFDNALFRFFRFQSESGEPLAPEGRVLSREVVEAPLQVTQGLQIAPGSSAIHLTRLRLINQRPLLSESIWLPKDKFSALLDVPLSEFGNLLYPFYEERVGCAVASAQEYLTVEPVGTKDAELLQIAEGTAVITVERVAFGYDQQPLEWRRYCGLASHFRYHIEIR